MSLNDKSVKELAKEYLELEDQYIKSLEREEDIDNKLKELEKELQF